MRRHLRRSAQFVAMIAGAGCWLALNAGAASSQSMGDYILKTQTCTALNCGATQLQGLVGPVNLATIEFAWETNLLGVMRNPWVGGFYKLENQCLRFNIEYQPFDLAMTVVSPDGTFYSNDNYNRPACRTCPLVVANGPTGIYTVIVGKRTEENSHQKGTFVMLAGRYYNGGANANPNCRPVTPRS